MKKNVLAVLMVLPFVLTACGTSSQTVTETEKKEASTETETQEIETESTENETETEDIAYALDPAYVGIWITGENEDTTAIEIDEDMTWQVLNIDEIEGFEGASGDVNVLEDAIELYAGDEVYDTLFFGAEENTLYNPDGATYTLDQALMESDIEDFVGVWQTGENEDMSYLVIVDDGTWSLLYADEVEGAEDFTGDSALVEDGLELYHEGELYNTLFFGSEADTLYSSMEYTYTLVSKDYDEIGD